MFGDVSYQPKDTPPMSASIGEEDALVRDAAHNPDAFAELYRRHVDRVYRFLLFRVGNVHEAQDLTSQTFLAALEGISRYQRQGTFAAWLIGIAQNKAHDYFRRSKEVYPLEKVSDVVNPDPSLDEHVDEVMQVEEIMAMLSELSPERAEALMLRIFGELSAAEVGQTIGKSEAAAKMLVHRALRDLRSRLRPADDSEVQR